MPVLWVPRKQPSPATNKVGDKALPHSFEWMKHTLLHLASALGAQFVGRNSCFRERACFKIIRQKPHCPQVNPERLLNFVLRVPTMRLACIVSLQRPAAALVPTRVPYAVQFASAVTISSVSLLNLEQLCGIKFEQSRASMNPNFNIDLHSWCA